MMPHPVRSAAGSDPPDGRADPIVSIVTVAFDSAAVIRDALEPIAAAGPIICVDNASRDDLQGALAGLGARILRNPSNLGFGRACNQGLAATASEFVLFINPDARLPAPALDALLTATQTYPDANIFQPLIRRADGTLWPRSQATGLRRRRLRHVVGELGGDFCSQFVDGSVFLVRRRFFEAIGGFDENMFLYFEDDDLSRRLDAMRQPIVVVHGAGAWHEPGRSVPASAAINLSRNRHKKISERYYRAKYGLPSSRFGDAAVTVAKILAYALLLDRQRLAGARGRLLGLFAPIPDPPTRTEKSK